MWSYAEDLTIEYCHEYYLFKKNNGGEGVLIDKADCHGGLKKRFVLPVTMFMVPLLNARG